MKERLMMLAAAATMAYGCTKAPAPMAVVPKPSQVEWQKMETNMFVHFGPNTFTSREWGNGQENPDIFNPTDLDCRQWVRTARAAGFKGVIITAKHHDGFCLWPNPVSNHTVAQSSWLGGKGDVLRDLSEACREYGLKFGIYISPWDRNDPHYGSDEYNEVFRKTLESAHSNYGDVFEQWFDGACGEGPSGKKQIYDWPLFHAEVYRHHPEALMFSDVGPGCRWMGNEAGKAGETCWSTLDTEGFSPGAGSPPVDTLNTGNAYGKCWVPAETDVSIRPGWFYKESENGRVKTISELLDIYYSSVGRNSLLLLNVPPDMRGHIHEIDSTRLVEFRAALDDIFGKDLAAGARATADRSRGLRFGASRIIDGNYDHYWAAKDGQTSASISFALPEERSFNRVQIQEYIPIGQRISSFSVEALDADGGWKEIARGTTIGYKRILLTETTSTTAVRVNIESAHACPTLNGFALFMDTHLGKNERSRDVQGLVDASRCRIISPEGVTALCDGLFDETHSTVLPANAEGKFESIVIELENVTNVAGIYYEPAEGGKGGCVMEYSVDASLDGKVWKEACGASMMDNIVNNPIERREIFAKRSMAKYLRFNILRSSEEASAGFAELGVIEAK